MNRVEREANLLDAAASIVVADGVEALTMEGIAAQAGINKAVVYRFFSNRDDVLISLWERETERFDAAISAALEGQVEIAAQLRRMIDTWLDRVETGGCLNRLEAPGVGSAALQQRKDARTEGVVRFLAQLIRDASGMSVQESMTIAAVLGKGAQGIAELHAHTGWPRAELVDTFVRVCVRAIRGGDV